MIYNISKYQLSEITGILILHIDIGPYFHIDMPHENIRMHITLFHPKIKNKQLKILCEKQRRKVLGVKESLILFPLCTDLHL